LRRQLRLAVPVAVATGLLLALYGWATRSYFATAVGADALNASVAPWPVRLLYGGITEEILARWGVMSLASYLAWRVSGGAEPPPERVFGTGNAVAALLFALGHLPMLAALTGSPPAWLLATVLAANAVAGLAFGWLYRRAGLEAAMLAHLLAHAVAAVPAAIMS
jgi:hypothetical protein